MGKQRREEKLKRRGKISPTGSVRPTNWRDLLKLFPGLFLRTFVVVFGLGLVMALLVSLGLKWFAETWVQFAVYIAGYFLLQRWIMGAARPGLPRK